MKAVPANHGQLDVWFEMRRNTAEEATRFCPAAIWFEELEQVIIFKRKL